MARDWLPVPGRRPRVSRANAASSPTTLHVLRPRGLLPAPERQREGEIQHKKKNNDNNINDNDNDNRNNSNNSNNSAANNRLAPGIRAREADSTRRATTARERRDAGGTRAGRGRDAGRLVEERLQLREALREVGDPLLAASRRAGGNCAIRAPQTWLEDVTGQAAKVSEPNASRQGLPDPAQAWVVARKQAATSRSQIISCPGQ